jgi:hypothetical protein
VSKSSTTQRHDQRAIKEFLMHIAGELRLHQLALEGKPVPPNLHKGITERRIKFGTKLLPDSESLSFLSNDPNEGDDAHRDAARQAEVSLRNEQLKQVMGVIALLGEVKM